MKYPHTREQSLQVFREAVPLMARQTACLNPHSFAIWYEHVSGLNPPLTEALSELLKSGPLTDADTEALFDAHVRERQTTRLARLVSKLLHEVVERARDAGADFNRLCKSLEQRQTQLEDDSMERAALVALVGDLRGDTQHLRTITGTLSQSFAANLGEFALLQKRLQEAEDAAAADTLTELRNRRGFETEVHAIIRRRGTLAGCVVMFVDVDHFKRINDSYGHVFGDTVLKAIATVLRKSIPQPSVVGRVGGEEFVVFLPSASPERAEEIAEQIRAGVARYRIQPQSGRAVDSLTVSIGVCIGKAQEGYSTLLERADRAMYDAKRAGRDRIKVVA